MYSLMLLLSLLTAAAFLHVFAFRRRGYLPAFVIFLGLLVYTHNWGLFMAAGSLVALVPVLVRVRRPPRVRARRPASGSECVGVLYLPWVPTLLHQIQHTGAPWLNSPNFGAPVQISKGLLGGGTPTVALLLAGGSGLAVILQRRVDDRERTAVIAGLLVPLATLAVAWLVSQVSPAWTTRYLGVILGPAAARQRGRARARRQARAGGARDRARDLGDPADVRAHQQVERRRPAQRVRARADRKGDLVLSMQPEQGPLLGVPPRAPRGSAEAHVRQRDGAP